ncbi:MAG: methyltransferase domain-containing protein [Armatimonadetes bacterium]|nr:methyltransferase domain-containing protein [Armatimonadota bacterium]
MDEPAALFLTSPEGVPVLERAASLPGDKAGRVLALRRGGDVAPNIAALAAEIAVSRERAARRGFADAECLFFTGDALAQATSPALSHYRAEWLARFETVADLCCGVGMDAIALAAAGLSVVAVDIDPVRLCFARANAAVRGVAERITFLQEPVESLGWTNYGVNTAFFDPARRTDAGRVSRYGDRYAPPLDFLHTIRQHVRGGCAKLSPALPDDVLRELSPSRVEFLSENRECKEACVWFGEAYGESSMDDPFTAVLLGGVIPRWLQGGPEYDAPAPKPGAYLLDPDPALIRAAAWGAAFFSLDSTLWSANDAYLATDTLPTEAGDGMASVYRVVEALPYAPKRVKAWLAENGYGRIVVKKRHFPQEPDAVARELGVSVRGAGREITLVLVRESANRFTAVFCEPV